ncbi:hypothetical protein GCM10028793_34230 [Nocardiopsis oceani]
MLRIRDVPAAYGASKEQMGRGVGSDKGVCVHMYELRESGTLQSTAVAFCRDTRYIRRRGKA